MAAPGKRRYKRSWRNYLLDSRYQLQFTLFMVSICALLMTGLGMWVMRAAQKATTVAMDNVLGVDCPEPRASRSRPLVEVLSVNPALGEAKGTAKPSNPASETAPATAPAANVDPANDGSGAAADLANGDGPAEAGFGADSPVGDAVGAAEQAPAVANPEERAERRAAADVHIEEAPLVAGTVPAQAIVRYRLCRAQQASTIERLRSGKRTILFVLIGVGMTVCFGLALYGIKMTHRVAGPLYKMGLYFDKMRDGKYDTVYNLRKGDQLVAFYELFKKAHDGMRTAELRELEMLRELVEAADKAGVAGASAEVAAAVEKLRELLKRKEDALG
jgi:hypothetical protein